MNQAQIMTLAQLIREPIEVTRLKCPFCEKMYKTYGYAKRHVETCHYDPRNHSCATCQVMWNYHHAKGDECPEWEPEHEWKGGGIELRTNCHKWQPKKESE